MSPDRPAPRATYRVQLHKGFTFDDAAAIVPYLAELGISHLYCSPYLQARPGSTHGYDVVDHSKLNEELGGGAGHARMVAALDAAGMSHIVDIVPNHMTITERANEWWWDVLKHGPQSPYAAYFDIDWDPPEARLKRHILVPVLGDHYGRVLTSGELRLVEDGEEAIVRYHEHTAPLAPGTVPNAGLAEINADPDRLHAVLEAQHYRFAYWRAAGADLNYRRFFAINDLAALRIENEKVFEATHALILDLVAEGAIAGLRVDHIDGLRYPTEYLERLRHRSSGARVWVEKILERDEMLRESWPVAGTTGYEFAARVQQLLIDPQGEESFTDLYHSLTGGARPSLAEAAYEAKMHLMNTELAPDIERLTESFLAVCEKHRDYRDFSRPPLRQTLRETIAAFAVYRSYCNGRTGEVGASDAACIRAAITTARKRRGDLDPELFAFLEDLLLLRFEGPEETGLAMRFQQTTGPVMAKGVEDTLFYRYNRFVALNEVGGDPGAFGRSLDDWHDHNARVLESHPETMLATSTHDTKRSEDVRARLACLSEIPQRWRDAITSWVVHNERHRSDDRPDRDMEYTLYQTLVGAWPIHVERVAAYLEKASKEAKLHTSWTDPDPHYDAALRRFVHALFDDSDFVGGLESFAAELRRGGEANSLVMALLKLTCPGIPDVYQGTELWDASLVDPDNRRPVDFDLRRSLLATTEHPKLALIRTALALRAERGEVFLHGTYEPLHAEGTFADHVIAHTRGGEIAALASRFPLSRPHGWVDTTLALPPGTWTDRLTGIELRGVIALAEALADRPVALLVRSAA